MVRVQPLIPSISFFGTSFYRLTHYYFRTLGVKFREIVHKHFILNIAEDQNVVFVDEAGQRVLVEPNALNDGVVGRVYFIKDVSIHDCVDVGLVRSDSHQMNWS